MSLPARRLLGLLILALTGMPAEPARAQRPAPPPPAEIILVGEDKVCASVQEAVAEALSREGLAATWGRQEHFQPEDIFERRRDRVRSLPAWPAEGVAERRGRVWEPSQGSQQDDPEPVAAWIDLSAAAEARLYFRDANADRFFIRSLPLARGIDEIAKEEIAHIVSKAVLALTQGGGEPLTRREARQALKLRPATDAAGSEAGERASGPIRFTIATMAGAQVFASDLPVVARGTLALALTRGPRWNRTQGSFGGWLDIGYQLPRRYEGNLVGADVQAASGRAGVLWEVERSVLLRFGLGAGVDRVSYQPLGDSARVDLASASSFYVPILSCWVGVDVRLLDWLALTSRISVDAPWAKVHFDLHDRSGQTTQVLVPYRVLPAASLGLALVL